MTTSRQTMSTNVTNHDNNLDALLEELQTSVSRPGSSLGMNGGTPMTGYREVTRTVMTEGTGHPGGKSTEYQIEYLNPSNSTTVLTDSFNRDLGLLKQSDLPPGSNVASYKTVQYEYKTSGSQNVPASGSGSDVRMRQNITELDSLLDDLHTAQKTGFADSGTARHVQGIDPGLLEPLESSTPQSGHVSRSVEKRTYQEQRYGSVGRQSPAREREVKRELVFTGGSKRDQPSPSPVQQRKEIYRYETHKTTRSGNSRDMSPPQDRRQMSPSPSPLRNTSNSPSTNRQITTKNYNYVSNEQDIPRAATMHRSPSPAGKNSSTTIKSYNYSTNQREYNTNQRDFSPDTPRSNRSQSPTTKVTSTTRTYNYNTPEPPRAPQPIKTVNSYSYSSTTRESNKNQYSQDVPRSPPPHRSPSPVSFTQPPLPSTKSTTVKTYNFEGSPRPQSPQPVQKFSPSDPSRTLTYQVSPPQQQVISYKYSSTSTHSNKYPGEEGTPLLPRPFPTPSPTPEQQQQQPPKKLDDLMASFSDSEIQQHHESSSRYYPPPREHVTPVRHEATPPPAPVPAQPTPPVSPAAATAAAMQVKSKNVAGPPVYYPPGVELFSKKEETTLQQQQQGGGGKMKAKAKAKYEYEASSKNKSKSSTSKTVVPVCLPVCCAMPCSIM